MRTSTRWRLTDQAEVVRTAHERRWLDQQFAAESFSFEQGERRYNH
ncbi:MAG: hypothetical protein U0795_14335 [Pirellulales bacterium]